MVENIDVEDLMKNLGTFIEELCKSKKYNDSKELIFSNPNDYANFIEQYKSSLWLCIVGNKHNKFQNLFIEKFYNRIKNIESTNTNVVVQEKNNNVNEMDYKILNMEVISEKKKVGRPKGSKNKEKIIIYSLPIYSVNDKNFYYAILDLLWYRNGLTAKQIVDQLECSEFLKSYIYAFINSNVNVYWTKKKINNYSKSFEVFFPIKERTGYFYDGDLLSLTKISSILNINKVTLWKRIKSGMNHLEAIEKPIDQTKRTNVKI